LGQLVKSVEDDDRTGELFQGAMDESEDQHVFSELHALGLIGRDT